MTVSSAFPSALIVDDTPVAAALPNGERTRSVLAAASPWLLGIAVLAGWEAAVRIQHVPAYLLPSPSLVGQTLVDDFTSLFPSLIVTLRTTILAFLAAAIGGLALGMLFTSSRWVERALFPYAIILQVTPVVSIAPLIIIWAKNTQVALLLCAWLVAFFPVLANAVTGLNSADGNLHSLFRIYGAKRWQILLWLKLPASMPYYLAGLRIAGGLALIGAVVAEFVAGTGGTESGLAYRILEAGYRLRIPRMFAALVMISASGIAIFAALSVFSRFMLRHWHDSEQNR